MNFCVRFFNRVYFKIICILAFFVCFLSFCFADSDYVINRVYNEENNTVTVSVISSTGFKDTKPTWTLSDNKKTYTKYYDTNGKYSTPFVDKNGVIENLSFEINEIDDKAPNIVITKEYDEKNGSIKVTAVSDEKLGDTKPTWILQDDKKTYVKVYNKNGEYTTYFEDIWKNRCKTIFSLNEIKSKYNIEKYYQVDTNRVKVVVTLNDGMKDTKPTWTLSSDKKTYTKYYDKNGKYSTPFVDKNGEVENLSFEINEIDDKAPNIVITKEYDEKNGSIKVTAVSDEKLGDTKPTWILQDDKKTYVKVYNKNGEYTTYFEDIWKNRCKTIFSLNEIKSKYNIEKFYQNDTNKVKVVVSSNVEIKETKPTWTLSSDKKTYTKYYDTNGKYSTPFVDKNGEEENLSFEINEIDDEAPNIVITKEYDEKNGVVKVIATSDEVLENTKPTWTLSSDKKTFVKLYNVDGEYTTYFEDVWKNKCKVSFKISGTMTNYIIEKKYDEENNLVTVDVISNVEFQNTKPTWTLSNDKKTYTKIYMKNGDYSTPFVNIKGETKIISFDITDIKSKFYVDKEYNEIGNYVLVSVSSLSNLVEDKPTWNLSNDKKVYTKKYYKDGSFSTYFRDENGYKKLVNIYIDDFSKSKSIKCGELPFYLSNEYNTKINISKNNALKNNNSFTFSLITDLHINNDNNTLKNLETFCKASNEKFVDAALVAGDLYTSYKTDRNQGLYYLNYINSKMKGNIQKSIYFTKGNHECNAHNDSSNYINNYEYAEVFNSNDSSKIFNGDDKDKSYYYVDYEKYKLRICVLNSYCGVGEEPVFGERQLNFIAYDALNFDNKENPDKWNVMFLTHDIDDVKDVDKFNDIVNAFKTSSKTNLLSNNIRYNFNGNVICIITGHKHTDRVIDNGIYKNITLQRGFNLQNEIGTKDEIAFELITIDFENRTLYKTRFGRGESTNFKF